jgi:hypothetical protein
VCTETETDGVHVSQVERELGRKAQQHVSGTLCHLEHVVYGREVAGRSRQRAPVHSDNVGASTGQVGWFGVKM